MKTGDIVLNKPSGEKWTVAFVEGDRLAWCGWPPGLARVGDCELVEECGPEESLALVKRLAEIGPSDRGTPDHRASWVKWRLKEIEDSRKGGRSREP